MKCVVPMFIAMFLFVCAACKTPRAFNESPASTIKSYVRPASAWSNHRISVCWKNPHSTNATKRKWVEDRVSREYQAKTVLTFTGWGTCTSRSRGIKIRIADEHPAVTGGLGRDMFEMILAFEFKAIYDENNKRILAWCADKSDNRSCIESIAVHEFGHAVGLIHEHNRFDRPASCKKNQQGSSDGGVRIGGFDRVSIMNYCNSSWNNGGVLSTGDSVGIESLYGKKWSDPHYYLVMDPFYYHEHNRDLRNLFKRDFTKFVAHWKNFSAQEGRQGSLVFDPKYYLAANYHLVRRFGSGNYKAAIAHFLSTGRHQGLRSAENFNVKYYLERYPDLRRAFGDRGYLGAFNHYIYYGYAEGREGSAIQGRPVFDPIFYRLLHSDLSNKWRADETIALRNHFETFGRKAGRVASFVFDAAYYIKAHPDLKSKLNDNYKAAAQHFIDHGIRQGRASSSLFDIKYYSNHHSDLRRKFGANNYKRALQHWYDFGLTEGRRASIHFDVKYYYGANADVRRKYPNNDYLGATMHWLQLGRNEGRRGAP